MLKKKVSKIISILMVTAVAAAIFAGCQSSGSSKQTASSEKPAKEQKEQVIVYNAVSDTNGYDPRKCPGLDQRNLLNQVFVGLVKYDSKGEVVKAVADSWKISDDKKTYTFTLRKDVKWSNGKNVVAGDFEYAWKSALDPTFGSETADRYYDIVGAEDYNKGKGKVEDIGVKALNDTTLEIKLRIANPFFLKALASPSFAPVRKDIVEKDQKGWTLKPETFIGNGPFKVVTWRPKDVIELVPNENYYNKNEVKLKKLNFVFVEEATTALAGFKTKTIDMFGNIPSTEIEKMIKDGTTKISPMLATYYFSINLGPNASDDVKKVLWNRDVREALNLAIDRVAIVEQVAKGGQTPAYGMAPLGIKGPDGKEFRDHKKYFDPKGDVAKAKDLLAKAGYADGKGFPAFELFYNTNQGHQAIAQAVQDMWKKNLGIDVKLVNKETKVFAEERAAGKYQITRSGNTCDPDYPSILGLFKSDRGANNEPKYSNPAYDDLITKAENESDVTKMFEYYKQAEDILMKDMPVIPIYYYTTITGIQKDVKNVVQLPSGAIYFEWAYRE